MPKKTNQPLVTDEEVEAEIQRIRSSEAYKLAQKEERLRNKRRKYMYMLRCQEKRGLALMKQGITMDNIESELFGDD